MLLRHVLMEKAVDAAEPGAGTGAALTAEAVTKIVTQAVSDATKPITQSLEKVTEENNRLREQIDELSKPSRHARQFLAGPPGVRTGEDPLTSRGLQLYRILGHRQGQIARDQCKVEFDLSARLRKIYVEQGGLQVSNVDSILVPFGSDMIHDTDSNLAAEVREVMQAGVAGFDLAYAQSIRQHFAQLQTISQFDDTALGNFLGPTARGEMIELVRAREAISQAGATEMPLPPNGRLRMDRQTGATTAYWVGQRQTITGSEPTTGLLEFLAKKLAVLVTSPNEMYRFASPTYEAFIRLDIATSMALKADRTAIDGERSSISPGGILNEAVQSHTASTTATNGDTFEPKDVSLMLAKLEDANFSTETDNAAWLMRAKMRENIAERRADAVSGGDQAGPYLFSMNRSEIGNGAPMRLRGTRIVTSSQVPNNRVKASGTDLTCVILGLWRHFIIGRVGVLEFATANQGDTNFAQDATSLRAIQHMDFAVRHLDAFVVCDDIDMDLPA